MQLTEQEKLYKKLKDEVKQINADRDQIITNAYVSFRDIQHQAKLDAKVKISALDEKLAKSKKKG